MRSLIWPIVAFLCLALLAATGVWWWAYGSALDRLAERGTTELSLASDRLLGQLQRYRQLAVVMSDHPGLIALLTEGSDQFVDTSHLLLLRTADKTGSYEIFVASASGRVVASSRAGSVYRTISDQPYFARAMYGALGTQQSQRDEVTGRAFYFAAPIKRAGEKPIGALVVKVSIEAVESNWRADPNVLFFTDRFGVVFVSNRNELLFSSRNDMKNAALDIGITSKYDLKALRNFPGILVSAFGDHEIWSKSQTSVLPDSALHLVQPLRVVGLRAEILLDTGAAAATALVQAAFAAAVGLIVGAGFIIMIQRRRAMVQSLKLEAEANQVLEDRVARRTEQLTGVNARLRQQIKERLEAEAALTRAQQDLVQAGKLSALGQMSAGISHELNQPLMAIRSFAENAVQFLDKGNTDTTRANLERISELARRMGRIIKNLRAFSRKEGEILTDVDLSAVIEAALELHEKRIENNEIKVVWHRDTPALTVRGGEVRLQQVLVNLIGNAIDAMEGGAEKRLEITVTESGPSVALSLRDTGPGLAEPEKIFEPFYTTKTVGQSEGMGLGLSISYGIVQSFGGRISGRNHPEGGSVFVVELSRAMAEEAA